MLEKNLSTKAMLSNIVSLRRNALELLKKDKPYSLLLKYLLVDNDFYSETKSIPPIKDIVSATGLNYGAVRKQINSIYEDLILNDEGKPNFIITKARYSFYLKGMTKDKTLHFEVEGLQVMPRIGEELDLPFFSAYMNSYHYYVEKITHDFIDGVQEVTFWLREGYYNTYWQYRKDKAWEENEIGLFEFLKLDEYDLKKRLGVGKW